MTETTTVQPSPVGMVFTSAAERRSLLDAEEHRAARRPIDKGRR